MTRRLIIEADGGSRGNPGPAGYGAVVRDGDTGAVLVERAGFIGTATNNVAEYNGLIAGAEAAREIDADAVILVRMDSKLVVEQMSGRWQIKHPDMKPLALKARQILSGASVSFEWIPRERNKAADALANEAMDTRQAKIARNGGASSRTQPPAPASAQQVAPASTPPAAHATDLATPRPPTIKDLAGQEFVAPLTVIFVRHGVTDMTATHRLSGSSVVGPPLNAVGRIQAAKAADALYRVGRETWGSVATVSRIVASPMQRTQDTAAALGRRLGLHVETDDRVKEVDFGQWEGLTADEAVERDGDLILKWQDALVPAPGGESIPDVYERMRSFLNDLAAEHAQTNPQRSTTVAVATHAVALKAAVGEAVGFAPDSAARMWPVPASMTLVQLRVTPDGAIGEGHLLAFGVPSE